MHTSQLLRKLLVSILLAVAVVAGFLCYTDLHALADALTSFRWWVLLPALLLTATNLAVRFVKWQYYLRCLTIRDVSFDDSLAIFLANYILILTPGKVGGFLKSYFLKQTNGVEMARSMPVMVVERLTDGLGMALMTTVALVAYPAAWSVVTLVVVGMLMVILLGRARSVAERLAEVAPRLPLVIRFVPTFRHLYESSHTLLQPRPLLFGTLLGTLARATEGLSLYFLLLGLGSEPSRVLFEQSIFIAALSNIIGVVVMMPGGLGGTEGSMAGLLDWFVGLTPASAAAATLLARFASLWVPALLGGLALVVKRRVFFPAESEELPVDAPLRPETA